MGRGGMIKDRKRMKEAKKRIERCLKRRGRMKKDRKRSEGEEEEGRMLKGRVG